jgi:hypothetical protein
MKKLLFLLCCAVLLLLASASPALAAFYYQVGPDGSAIWVDESTLTWGPFVGSMPGADVRVGISLVAITRGGAISQSKNMLFRLEVTRVAPGPTMLISKIGASDCQRYWSAPYHYNDWMTDHPELVITPYNGSQAGVWAMDWLVPMPPLTAGTYRISYSDKVLHKIADPLFAHPWEYQHVYPHDWLQWDPVTFVVQ